MQNNLRLCAINVNDNKKDNANVLKTLCSVYSVQSM